MSILPHTKRFAKLFFLIILFLGWLFVLPQATFAQSVNLNQFVAGLDFVPHTLSTGESISFTSEGSPGPGQAVRMIKGGNYEQFFLSGSGIYRREDTSWAPLPGFVDASCNTGGKAIYTLDPGCTSYAEGGSVTKDGVVWSPNVVSVGQSWNTTPHQILTIHAETQNGRNFCQISNPPGYPACSQSQTILLEEYYPKGEYTFCTGIKNEDDVIKVRVTGGYGSGDTFFFMRKYGLVGFEAPGFESGLMGPGADPSGCKGVQEEEVKISSSPVPEPYVACGEVRPDFLHPDEREFHSLRPYQASPCDTRSYDTVLSCGNDFVLKKGIVVTPEAAVPGSCVPTSDGGQKCHFEVTVDSWIQVTFPESELPIMGNTELVNNSISQISGLNAPTRMNEYVSWFLNGVPFRAEETPGKIELKGSGSTSTPTTPPGASSTNLGKIMVLGDSITEAAYSWPYLCLLKDKLGVADADFVGNKTLSSPFVKCGSPHHEGYGSYTTQNILALSSWKNISADTVIILLGTNDVASGVSVNTTINNLKNIIGILRSKNSQVKILLSQVIPAKNFNVSPLNNQIANLAQELNSSESPVLTVSQSNLSFPADYTFPNGTVDAVHPGQSGAEKIAGNMAGALENITSSSTAPGSSTPTNGEYNTLDYAGPLRKLLAFASQEYQREKQVAAAGSSRHNQIIDCFVPLLGNPVPCYQGAFNTLIKERVKNPVTGGKGYGEKTDQYVPLSSTEDRVGNVMVRDIQNIEDQPASEVTLHWVTFNPTPAGNSVESLFFAHMEESSRLASLLQNTFIPSGEPATSGSSGQQDFFRTLTCEQEKKVTNPGDKLFGDTHLKEVESKLIPISGVLTFVADFDCSFAPDRFDPTCFNNCMNAGGNEEDCRNQCTKFAERTCKKDALAAISVYTKTPKLEDVWERLVNGDFAIFKRMYPKSLIKIEDIPGYTTANYSATAMGQGGTATNKKESVLAGDPAMNRPGEQAEIFFPHLGSIQENFLYGIQKALRPFSEAVSGGTPTSTEDCIAPQPYSQELSDLIDKAIQNGGAAAKVPKSVLEAIYAIEGFTKFTGTEEGCKKNTASALGLMSITDDAYNRTVPPDQRVDNEEDQCGEITGKINRCNPIDSMELAARVLLFKIGLWQNYQPIGSINNRNDVYRAAYGYYGCYDVDKKTMDRGNDDWGDGQGPVFDNRDGCTNYSEVICARSGFCRSSTDYPWPRPNDNCQLSTPSQCKSP